MTPRALYRRHGFTIIETILAAGMAGFVFLALWRYQTTLLQFFRHVTVNQSINQDARRAVDMINLQLHNAQAGTISISTPDPSAPPNSRIDFIGVDQSSYTITWSSTPTNSIHILQTAANSTITHDSILASNARSLMFFFADFRDPSVVGFTLQLQAVYGAAALGMGNDASALIANQIVQTVNR